MRHSFRPNAADPITRSSSTARENGARLRAGDDRHTMGAPNDTRDGCRRSPGARPPAGSVDPGKREEAEMFTNEMARERSADLLREAEAERLARSTRAGRTADERSAVRRVARTVVAALLYPIPFRH
jgi:hypothetical protein